MATTIAFGDRQAGKVLLPEAPTTLLSGHLLSLPSNQATTRTILWYENAGGSNFSNFSKKIGSCGRMRGVQSLIF
jgi:hypothetical protein